MHLPTLIKKSIFFSSGKLVLSDAVRNEAYRWAWDHLRQLPTGSIIIDIGSRDSLFPAFLAWRRYLVRIIERDARFYKTQEQISRRWRVSLIIDNSDFLAATFPESCDAICSLFSLQHAGDDDIAGYRYAAQQLRPGALFLSATEYRCGGGRFHYGRDDGTMRIYGQQDVIDRIESPLIREAMVETDRQYLTVSENGEVHYSDNASEQSSILLLLFRKQQ